MAFLGMNVGRLGEHDPQAVRSLGATWVRIVAYQGADISDYLKRCRAAGVKILLVLARESGFDFIALLHRYEGLVDAIQVGNEPDLDSPSSWAMSPQEFRDMGRLVREAVGPTMPIVAGGLASGQPSWLDPIANDLEWANALAVHPYLKDAPNDRDIEDLQDVNILIDQYRSYGLDVIVTEWGWWGTDERRGREEVSDMVMWAAHTQQIKGLFYFCLTDAMVPPFGLLRADGSYKPAAGAFTQAAQLAMDSGWPPVLQAPPAPEPQPTIPASFSPWQFFSAEDAARATGANLANVRLHWPKHAEQLRLAGIWDRPTAIAVFATIVVEVGARFEPIPEYSSGQQYEGRADLGNVVYGDGPRYKGQGTIQITGRANYRTYSKKVMELWNAGYNEELDFEKHPENALEPDNAAAIAATFVRDHNIPAMAAAENWAGVRRAVNGGMNGWQIFADAVEALKKLSPHDSVSMPPDEGSAADYIFALKTLRDITIPALEAQLAELRRIVEQFVGKAA